MKRPPNIRETKDIKSQIEFTKSDEWSSVPLFHSHRDKQTVQVNFLKLELTFTEYILYLESENKNLHDKKEEYAELLYNYATGKDDGDAIVKHVKGALDKI